VEEADLGTPDHAGYVKVALSSGADKREAWEQCLLCEKKLGALALLRNLRNMREAGVDETLVLSTLGATSTARVSPFGDAAHGCGLRAGRASL